MGKSKSSTLRGVDQEAGRTRLIAAARALLRERVKHEISRKDIARRAGVAPGLMTYHFATNRELVIAAVQPVIMSATQKLFIVIDSDQPEGDRFRDAVLLLLEFAEQNASLLDIFVETLMDHDDEELRTMITDTVERLSKFFEQAVKARLFSKSTNPRFLLLALWGMCRRVGSAQPIPLHVFDPGLSPAEKRQVEADLIVELVLHGVGH